MKSRSIRLILIGIMAVLILVPSVIYAADKTDAKREKAYNTLKTIPDPFMYRGEKAEEKALKDAKTYPAKFDLRDVDGKNYVTPVKLQNPFGTCWGFAAIAAAETSVLSSGLAEADGYDVDTLDFSEKHLVNFLVSPLSDPESPQNGEGMYYVNSDKLEDKFNMGGFTFFATSLFSSGIGPVLESRDPVLEYHGANKDTEKRKVDGKWIDFSYSDEDDWSIPEDWRRTQSYVLKESYMLPSPAKWVVKDGIPTYEHDEAATAAIKEQLMNLRAVEMTFFADQAMPDQNSDGKYISKNWAHYTYFGEQANHAVTVVGWDDDYDKSNFVEGHQPPENGAWLVKNSWGSGEEEFPNHGNGKWGMLNDKGEHTGYFWLSYYDMSLGKPEALAFDKSNVGKGYILSQHDFLPATQITSTDLTKETKMANVFKADICETLEQITCQTTAPGTTVDYEVYLLRQGYKDPEDGLLITSGGTSYEYGGYHKIDIEPQIIQRGQHYSVIITQKTPEGKYNVNSPSGYSKELSQLFGMPLYAKAVINPGESYVLTDGKWKDYSVQDVQMAIHGDFYITMEMDNFPIRAFCTPRDNLYLSVTTGNTMYLKSGDEVTEDNIYVKFKGEKGKLPENAELEWEASEGSDKFFTMTPDPEDSSRCMVAPKAVGSGYVKVTSAGAGSQVIRVFVRDPNTLKVSGKTAKVSYKKLKKKNMSLAVTKVMKFSNKGQGAKTYSFEGATRNGKNSLSRFDINDKTGTIKIRKKTKKGTYKIIVQIAAAGNDTNEPVKKNVTFKIKVK